MRHLGGKLSPIHGSFCKSNELSLNIVFCLTGNAEEHATLSRALSQLAEVEEKIEQLHIQQV